MDTIDKVGQLAEVLSNRFVNVNIKDSIMFKRRAKNNVNWLAAVYQNLSFVVSKLRAPHLIRILSKVSWSLAISSILGTVLLVSSPRLTAR